MNKLLEIVGLISVGVAALFAAIRSGLISPRATPYRADESVQDELKHVEEAHGERVEEIEEAASAICGASRGELADEFDSAFGAVPKVDPFEPRSEE